MEQQILLVDDNLSFLRSLELMLSSRGFKAKITDNSTKAISIIKQNPKLISHILIDLTIDEMMGHDVLVEIQDITEQYGIKVIFQSGTGKETDFSKARKLGANHCLSIPYGYKDLLLLLQQSQTHSSIESFA
ncbi:MAG: response regulator [Rickettsiaceae bacterium]|nr:response regulator [Rickettsiaceae bacterium]